MNNHGRKISRRGVLIGGIGLSAVIGGSSLYHMNHVLPPRDIAAEERFRRLQDGLLAHEGIQFSSRFFDLAAPAVRTHVIDSGQGTPVLMIHGGNSVAVSWAPLLSRLQRTFHIYAPDRPGCGLTEKFNYLGIPFREHAVAFVRSTMDALGLKRAALVGSSMGGYFSLAFALAHPERVSQLVTIGEPAGSARTTRPSHRLLGTPGINSALYATVMKPGSGATRRSFQGVLVADINRVSQPYLDCCTAGSLIPGATESWLTMVENVTRWNGDSTLTYKLRSELPNLTVPTLMIWGDKDTFGPPSLGAEMVALMPHARMEMLADAGHIVWLDQLDRSEKLIESFLRS
jgi:pimeloyl-ACP methyl ester carboxylesterase